MVFGIAVVINVLLCSNLYDTEILLKKFHEYTTKNNLSIEIQIFPLIQGYSVNSYETLFKKIFRKMITYMIYIFITLNIQIYLVHIYYI